MLKHESQTCRLEKESIFFWRSNFSKLNLYILKLVILFCLSGVVLGDVSLPSMFTDHAVLARTGKTPIFGKAQSGEKVSVCLGNVSGTTLADANGHWRMDLDLSRMGEGPFELTVSGQNRLVIQDVMVGEVWLCSGQSNMEFDMTNAEGAGEALASCKNSKIRLFCVPESFSKTPEEAIKARWVVVNPKDLRGFSAVGYYFGREIQKAISCPVGLIDNAKSGSSIFAWMTMESLSNPMPLKEYSANIHNLYQNYEVITTKYIAEYEQWGKSCEYTAPLDNKPPANVTWKNVKQFGCCSFTGNGVVWARRKIEFSAEQVKQDIPVIYGTWSAPLTVFMDGKPVFSSTLPQAVACDRLSAKIPKGTVSAGEHEILFRFLVSDEKLENRSFCSFFWLPLKEGWEIATVPYKPLTAEQTAARPERPPFKPMPWMAPEQLYNGMVAPLRPYAISGMIWYQGCSDTSIPNLYAMAIQNMIRLWRKELERDFPFYYCQLANYHEKDSNPANSGWASFRCAQDAALALPGTGRSVLIDVGESEDIHFLDKYTVGKRLAAIALNRTYGKDKVICSGPVCSGVKLEGDGLRLSFDCFDSGLMARPLPAVQYLEKRRNRTAPLLRNSPDSELEGFALCGADGKWYWADAKIDKNTVFVRSSKVNKPVKVRYAYQSNPTCNLYNRDGFPAVPFEKSVSEQD